MYLSDQVFIDIPFSTEGYINYTIDLYGPDWSSNVKSNQRIFGRVYAYKEGQKIYMNDILNSYADNYSWMSYENINNLINQPSQNVVKLKYRDLPNVYTQLRYTIGETSGYKNINMMHIGRGGDTKSKFDFISITSSNPASINLLSHRTSILPRIPKLETDSTDFFVGGAVALTKGWANYSTVDGSVSFRLVALDHNKKIVLNDDDQLNTYQYPITSPVFSVLAGGYLMAGISPGVLDNKNFKYLAIAPVHQVNGSIDYKDASNHIVIAEYDDHNADYYLIWCDRTGGYQCQPFCKKSTMSEDIASTTITNSFNEERPYLRTVTTKWQLNSDWLSYEEYKAYESIFTSPYTYLFDVKHNELTPVMCTDKSWTEKSSKNTRKPFNLKITVTDIRKQNIVY